MPDYAAHFGLLDDGGELVTATRRQAHELARAHAARQLEAGRSVWPTPRILPWTAWLVRLWHEAAREGDRRPVLLDAFAAGRAWGHLVSASATGRGLLDARAAARGAMQAWTKLHDWRLDLDAIDASTAEHAAFLDWARTWRSQCAERGWVDAAALTAALEAELPSLAAVGAVAPRIGFHGFETITPSRRRLTDALERSGVRTVELQVTIPDARARRYAADDPASELDAIAAWLVARLRADPAARLAVIVPDLAERWQSVRRAMDDRLQPAQLSPGTIAPRPYVSSSGPRLRDYALVDVALRVLGLGRERIDLVDVGRLLRSPYPRGADSEAARRAGLDAFLRHAGEREPTVERVRLAAAEDRHGCPAFATLVDAVRRGLDGPERRTSAQWATAFERALGAAGWHDARPLTSDEFQTAAKFHEALATLGGLDGVLGSLTLAGALAELESIVADVAFQPESADAQILFLDTLAAPGLALDGLWVAGLTAESFPAAASPDPFLPLELQRRVGMPHASSELELDYARRTLRSWLGSAAEVVLSWPRRDDDGERLASPLVPTDLAAFEPADGLRSRAAQVRASASLEAWSDVPLPPLPAGTALRGGVAVLAAQSACPFRAGVEHRLGVRPLERPGLGLDARRRGTLAHEALAAFWRDVRSQRRLRELGREGTVEHIRHAIDLACLELPPDVRRSRLLLLERRWLERAMLALADKELERAPFEVVGCEAEYALTIGRRRLDVRIDRIDRLDDGATVLIDYKTGQGPLAAARWTGDRPDQPQLPTYAAHLPDTPVAVAFGRLALVAVGFAGLSARKGLLPDVRTTDEFRHEALRGRPWDSLIEEWQRVTTALVDAYARGVADVDPTDDACRYCAHAAVCRIESVGADVDVPGTDDDD